MTEFANRCLDTFPEWLRTLATDASDLAQILSASNSPETVKRYVAGGLNYLFKSLDLIPDGIEDLGFLDDCFVIRVASALALAEALGNPPESMVDTMVRLTLSHLLQPTVSIDEAVARIQRAVSVP